MKKYIYTIIILSFVAISCSDSFLEEKMVSVITQDYFDTEEGLEQLINGTYDALRWKYGWEEGSYLFHVGADAEIRGDNSWDIYSPTVWTPSGAAGNTYANYLMGYYGKQLLGGYPIINNCNRAIESIRNETALGRFATDQQYASERLSEALFTRAWVYYMLNTQFGDVHMTLKSNNSLPDAYNFPKSTSEEIYRQIITDLRYCYDHLPDQIIDNNSTVGRERISKGAVSHFLAKLYLQRAQGANFSNYRKSDGSIDHSNPNAHLGMLYKGSIATDLDSCIFFANQVISNTENYRLADDFADIFAVAKGSYPSESNSEIILAASFGPNLSNTRYGMRFHCYMTCNYVNTIWGLPNRTWEYGHQNVRMRTNDWGYDVFTDKISDSRFEKTFLIEYKAMLADGENDVDYYSYNDPQNGSKVWTESTAAYFNTNILPSYTRASWNNRPAVAGDHKIGRGDLGLVFLENTKETAITIEEAKAQPYVLYPRWIKDGDKYYYRRDGSNDFVANNVGLEKGIGVSACVKKHIDVNRTAVNSEYGSRNVAIFRIAETYLIRAEAHGRKGDFTQAINDINKVRERAAYKSGENRAEVLARLYPGSESLTSTEKHYPYTVANTRINDMKIDASYWDGASASSIAENYPSSASTDLQRFIHFIYNELTREMIGELTVYEGIHHAGIQAERIIWHQQMGSTLQGHWPTSDNVEGGQGQTGNGKGAFKSHYTFKPFPQTFIDMLTDESGNLLDQAAKADYQNPGYN